MSNFSHARFEELLNSTVDMVRKLAEQKGGEYAGDTDRLANFRRNGAALGLEMEQIWAVYAGKHWDAVQQYIKDIGEKRQRPRMESIEGRVDDLIVYLVLFKAILDERNPSQVLLAPQRPNGPQEA